MNQDSRSSFATEQVTQAVKESFVRGFRVVMLIAAAMALAGGLTSFFLIENKKPRTHEGCGRGVPPWAAAAPLSRLSVPPALAGESALRLPTR